MTAIHARVAIKINGRPVPARVVLSIWGFFSAYILTFVFLMLMMMWTGVDQVTAFSAIATCMNNLGPGLGEVSTSFVQLGDSGLLVAVVAMLLGRLEIFTFFVLVSPSFWKR